MRLLRLLSAMALLGCGSSSPAVDAGSDSSTPDASIAVDAAPAVDAAVDPDSGVVASATVLRSADFAACETYGALPTSLPSEMNHLTANRLTPTSYPFTVRQVGYFLELSSDDGQCNAGFAHRVDLYVTSDATPPNEPGAALVASIDVPAATPPFADTVDMARSLRHTLATPVTIAEGQHLYIAVQLTAGTPNADGVMTQSLCASGCVGGAETSTMFWSNAATVPYAWGDLFADFGIDFELGAWASDEVAE